MNLIENVDIISALTAVAESTAVNSQRIDLEGCDGVMWIVCGSTTFAAAALTVTPQMSTASTSTLTSASGTLSTTKFVAGTNNRIAVIDCVKPTERYMRIAITGSSSGNVNNILAIKYNLRRPGSTELQDSATIAGSTMIISPSSS